MYVQRLISFILVLLFSFSLPASADNSIWQDIKSVSNKSVESDMQPYQKARMLKLSLNTMAYALEAMARENLSYRFATVESSRNIALPLPDGSMIEVELVYESLLENSLKTAYPAMKTYRVLPSAEIVSGIIDMTSQGFHAMLQTSKGKTIFIDPVKNKENTYVSFYKDDQRKHSNENYSCGVNKKNPLTGLYFKENKEELKQSLAQSQAQSIKKSASSEGLLVYRIAIAATGEYTEKHGGTVEGALAAMVTTLSRINQVFEKDLGIHLSLVANNDAIIYTDADSDPYSGNPSDSNYSKELMKQNQSNLDAVIGSANYDIGHLFSTRGGGLASIAGICNQDKKGQGVSGISNPINDTFNLDFVAHELGHQLGATHTFNGNQGLCAGATRTSETAFEPGSGSSLMSYAGYCAADNLQSKTDAMFHIGSIQQIRALARTSEGNCGLLRHSLNRPPIVKAGKNYVIPTRTPFELTGKATDPDADTLVYSWEQLDAGESSQANEDKGDNALFRLYMPSNSVTRSFPSLESLINHKVVRGEKLPEKQRKLNFSFVAQDNHHVAQSDDMVVEVYPTKTRFSLYLPRSQYSRGDTHKILWNVGGTNESPIRCDNVNISLSTDGGYNFPVILEENVPNTGVVWLTIPATMPLSKSARFKINCSNNIFYAISYRNFEVAERGTTGIMLADEDQLEPDTGNPNVGGGTKNLTKSAGGSVDLFPIWLLFLMISLREISRNSSRESSKNS